MAIRIMIGRMKVECDRPEEAIQIIKLGSRGAAKVIRTGKTNLEPAGPAKASDLYINGAKALFDALKSAFPEGVPTAELATAMGIDTKSLPPMILGIKRRASKLGVNIDMLLVREIAYKSGRPSSRYRLTQEGMNQIFNQL